MRRGIAVAVALLFLACSATSLAAKGVGHGSSRGSSKRSGSKSSGGSKPTHVKAYTKKDRTHVEAHDRKARGPKTETRSSERTTHSASPIRIYTDPATGRKTLTNKPKAPLAAKPLTAVTVPTSKTSMTIAPSMSAINASHKGAIISGVSRNAKGRIARSETAKHTFEVQTGYPHGRPGYVIDHIKPLACGGADAPSNMQWQTIAEGKAKDRTERVGCR